MRKIYFTFCLFFLATSLNAQDFFIKMDTLEIHTQDANSDELAVKTYLVNNTAQALDVSYTINGGNLIQTDWDLGFCNDATCDNPKVKVSGTFTMAAGDSTEIKVTLLPNGHTGFLDGLINFNATNNTNVDRLKAYYSLKVEADTTTATSIVDINSKNVSVYPNPTSDYITIETNNETENTAVGIYSILGKQIYYTTEYNQEAVDVREFKSGVYLIKLYNEQKDTIYISTFVKK